jgi:hypothetical protein
MSAIVVYFAIALLGGFAATTYHINNRADAIELLLDGVIERLDKLENK